MKKKKFTIILPPNKKSLFNYQLLSYIKKLKIPYFRGIFCRDELPKKPHKNECIILNLDTSSGLGSHWVSAVKKGRDVVYYDSFGNVPMPEELLNYFRGNQIYYNRLGHVAVSKNEGCEL